MDFVTVSTGLILPYWMGLPIRYIQLKDVNESKIYIFNFDTNQQTQDFYDLLCKKVDKVGVHILSESAHHYKASNPFGQSQVIHYSEPPNPRRESLQILK